MSAGTYASGREATRKALEANRRNAPCTHRARMAKDGKVWWCAKKLGHRGDHRHDRRDPFGG